MTTPPVGLPYTPTELERKYERADLSMNRGLFIKGFAPARTTKIFEFSLAKLKGHDLRGSVPSFFSCQRSAFSSQLSNFSRDKSGGRD
jgi:hypothetical protein